MMSLVLRLMFLGSLALLAGCDFMCGVERTARVHEVPNLGAVQARIQSYPEITTVRFREADGGGRPITFSGLQAPDRVFYLMYSGGDRVHGTLQFSRDDKGRVTYSNYLIALNTPPPQRWIDGTWPIMKRIERDLEEQFGLVEIKDALKIKIARVQDPDRPGAGK